MRLAMTKLGEAPVLAECKDGLRVCVALSTWNWERQSDFGPGKFAASLESCQVSCAGAKMIKGQMFSLIDVNLSVKDSHPGQAKKSRGTLDQVQLL